jgi:glycosyltransferase involved in cell wall biosynthesis
LGLVKALMRDGHELIALSPDDKYAPLLQEDGVRFEHISINAKGVNPLEDMKLMTAYYRKLKQLRPDMVLAYTIKPNIYATLCCHILRIPVINNVSGLGTVFIRKSLSSYIAVLMYKIAFHKSPWVFFQNETDRNVFVKLGVVRSKRSGVLPGSGVNLEKFYCERADNPGRTFLFVGRLIGDKGIRELLEAAQELMPAYPAMRVLIAGELGYNNKTAIGEEELNGWLQNPQIKYLGMQDDMKGVYMQADVMVLPSYREGTSKSLIEAAAMKLPIITTNVPGCREVVEEGKNGLLCKPRNSHDLARKMEQMMQLCSTDRLSMGLYGRHKAVTDFDEKIVIDLYRNKINELIQKEAL